MNREILQIIPAVGWFAVIEKDGVRRKWRLTCFALCSENGQMPRVMPMVVDDFAEDIEGFIEIDCG